MSGGDGQETCPFTPEQRDWIERRLHDVLRRAVAGGVGDMPRILAGLDFSLIAAPLGTPLTNDDLSRLRLETLDEANAAFGIVSNCAGERR